MIIVGEVLVDEAILENHFVCDLAKCKGGCCENGMAGAPLEWDELSIISEIYEQVKPYLTEAAISEIDRGGKYVNYENIFNVTPSIESDSRICVYGFRDANGVIKCAFEQAYYDGKTKWKKPISCHLFPIIARGKEIEEIRYEPREKLCNPACTFGDKLKVPVYVFLKEAIVRKYGEYFYETLNKIKNGNNL